MTITVPQIAPDADALTAALAYARGGLFVGPVARGTKNPGSVLRGEWPRQTSTDPQMIAAWFAGADHGVFLHAGRSGLVVFDVDTPDNLHPDLARAFRECEPPYQTTREGDTVRGHYLFAVPEGRTFGNGTGTLTGGWGDVRGANGVVVVAPSVHQHAADGGLYRWQRTGPVPVLPDYLAAHLTDGTPSAGVATPARVKAFMDAHTTAERPGLTTAYLNRFTEKVAAGESRHQTATSCTAWAMEEAAAGYVSAQAAAEALAEAFTAAVTQPGHGHQGAARAPHEAANEFAGILAWSVAQAEASDPQVTRARVSERLGITQAARPRPTSDTATTSGHERAQAVRALVDGLRGWQDVPDPTHIVATLAAAATRHGDGEPCWLLLVAPPSSGKTEAVRLLDDAADARLDEVTPAGLLGWSKGKTAKPTGLLYRVGAQALVTFGDLSTLLATSDRGGRDQVFAILRRAYDGHVTRDVAAMSKVAVGSPDRLEWSGRLTVVGCVTQAIDRQAAHNDALGARWLYCRLPARDTAAKRRAAAVARRGGLTERRAEAAEAVAHLLASLPESLPEVPDGLWQVVEDAALVTAWGRGAVPRSGYGRREMEGPPVVEEPMRLTQQLAAVARGVLALGLPEGYAAQVVRRLALDSMPEDRRAVLTVLAQGEELATAAVGRAAGLDRKVARFTLEDLQAIGVVTNDRVDDESEELTGTVRWTLAGEDGALVAEVIHDHTRQGTGWDELWDYSTPLPPERGQGA
ncbi:bifunctional DNA primase/polymerase [Kytococcus sedentarius]|uniref:bifunctional DNA primase/polymerase n=1 Tax=Kytococcus sedentarius TaxID=1276 RepID=UPI0035BC1FE0